MIGSRIQATLPIKLIRYPITEKYDFLEICPKCYSRFTVGNIHYRTGATWASPNFTGYGKHRLLPTSHSNYSKSRINHKQIKLQVWIIVLDLLLYNCYQQCRNPFSRHREIVGCLKAARSIKSQGHAIFNSTGIGCERRVDFSNVFLDKWCIFTISFQGIRYCFSRFSFSTRED